MAIVHKLYDGEVEMVYSPGQHSYTINGVPVPSVTKITGIIDKPALMYWAVNETADRIKELWQPDREYGQEQIDAAIEDAKGARFRTSQKALSIGSQAHDWIEQYIKSKIYGFTIPNLPDYPPVKEAVAVYLEWEEESNVTYTSSEKKVCSLEHMYSGTVDIDMIVGDKRVVADLKTSKGIYPEYKLQCAAYAAAMSEESGVDYDAIAIIRIPKDGSAEIEVSWDEDIQSYFDVFLACLTIWRWKNDWEG